MHVFNYDFLKSAEYADNNNLTSIIFDLRAREEIRSRENAAMFSSLQKVAVIDTVRSSNAIEGIVTTRSRINEIINSNSEPQDHDEKEILGYGRALDEIYGSDKLPALSQEYIKHLHALLLMETDSREAGKYKSIDNWIQERDEQGRIKVRFVPVSASETDEAMEQLIAAYYEARQDASVNKLLLVSCFVVDFLCIHPFMDGNGRVSRLLTGLVLMEAGFDIGKYISIDKKIDEFKMNYYQALSEASQGWHENENDYNSFIRFILQILYKCYKELDDKFIDKSIKAAPKGKQIELALLESFVPVSKRELCDRFPEISAKTIENVLGKMVKEEKIEKIGTFKDARYKKK